MPRYIVTDKNPRSLGNGSLNAGDEYEADHDQGMILKALGLVADPPDFPPRTQRAPQAASVAPITAEVSASADAEVIRATDQEDEPQPEVGSDRYERRDLRPEE